MKLSHAMIRSDIYINNSEIETKTIIPVVGRQSDCVQLATFASYAWLSLLHFAPHILVVLRLLAWAQDPAQSYSPSSPYVSFVRTFLLYCAYHRLCLSSIAHFVYLSRV